MDMEHSQPYMFPTAINNQASHAILYTLPKTIKSPRERIKDPNSTRLNIRDDSIFQSSRDDHLKQKLAAISYSNVDVKHPAGREPSYIGIFQKMAFHRSSNTNTT